MKSIRMMLLAIFLVVTSVPFSFQSTSNSGSIYTVIGFYGGLLLFTIGFIMSFFKKEADEVKDKEKSDEDEE